MAGTELANFTNTFTPIINHQFTTSEIEMTEYQKQCVLGAAKNIYELVKAQGINLKDSKVVNDISKYLLQAALLQLNANAEPREVYFQTRNYKDENGNYKKSVEMGIEGAGNDAILKRFGRDVKFVYPVWVVREGDVYVPSKHRGVKITDPEWEPKDQPNAKAIRVVYPIELWTNEDHTDSTLVYLDTTRELVKPNLIAHMMNNIRTEQYKKADLHKKHVQQIKDFVKDHTVDEILDDDEMQKVGKISPAWSEPQSREQMIIRKMRNNIVKKFPKDFSNGLVTKAYGDQTDENAKSMRKEVNENANQDLLEPSNNETSDTAEDAHDTASGLSETVRDEVKDDSIIADSQQAASHSVVDDGSTQDQTDSKETSEGIGVPFA